MKQLIIMFLLAKVGDSSAIGEYQFTNLSLVRSIFQAVEKYSIFLAELSASIREVSRHFQETELPNEADTTYNLLQDQGGEHRFHFLWVSGSCG